MRRWSLRHPKYNLSVRNFHGARYSRRKRWADSANGSCIWVQGLRADWRADLYPCYWVWGSQWVPPSFFALSKTSPFMGAAMGYTKEYMVFLPVCFKHRAKRGQPLGYSSVTYHCLSPKCNNNCIDCIASARAYSIVHMDMQSSALFVYDS